MRQKKPSQHRLNNAVLGDALISNPIRREDIQRNWERAGGDYKEWQADLQGEEKAPKGLKSTFAVCMS